jgi:hypothetical protein
MYTCDRLETNKCMPVANYSLGTNNVYLWQIRNKQMYAFYKL